MKKFFTFFIMFSFVFVYSGLSPVLALVVQRGTNLTITLTDSYDSKNVEVGQRLNAKIADDV